jgi:hypothetical protein
MGALTMREAMRLDCVWIVSTFDKSFEKVHVVPETFAVRNNLLVEIIQDIPFLRMVELPQKYKPALPQLANDRTDIDFTFLGGEDLVDEYYNEFKRRKVMQMFVSKSPVVGIKRRTTVRDGEVRLQSLLNSQQFDYFAEVGKPIVVSRDFYSTSSTTVRAGLAGDTPNARAELRKALGRRAATALLDDPAYANYLGLLRAQGGNTTGYLTLIGRGLTKANDALVISNTRVNANCANGPAAGRGVFLTSLTPLRIQTLFAATMVYLTSEVPVHCIELRPTSPIPGALYEAIQLVLRRYPFLTVNFDYAARPPPYVLRIHEQQVGARHGLPAFPAQTNMEMTADARNFVIPPWTQRGPDADGYTVYTKAQIPGALPAGTTVVDDALPWKPWTANNNYQGMIDQAELPREIFEACAEMGFEVCSRR